MKKIVRRNMLPAVALLFVIVFGCRKDSTAVQKDAAAISTKTISNASSDSIVNVHDQPIDAVAFNECCGEEVHFYGTAHILVTKNIIHMDVINMTGVGLTSNLVYTGRGASVQTNVFYSNQFEGILTADLNMTATGCSFRLSALFHIEVNANGVVTSEMERVETKCS